MRSSRQRTSSTHCYIWRCLYRIPHGAHTDYGGVDIGETSKISARSESRLIRYYTYSVLMTVTVDIYHIIIILYRAGRSENWGWFVINKAVCLKGLSQTQAD